MTTEPNPESIAPLVIVLIFLAIMTPVLIKMVREKTPTEKPTKYDEHGRPIVEPVEEAEVEPDEA